ncbi:Chlorophyll A-B binding protein [Prochlorococcus marinus str. MIT 1342]|uniref:Possible high light inducible protein n=2 Tax=Prochlorococcus marinus TaxID=1219 RepID=Q7V6K7_PROMM|nr:possible high light inducible protein [Prochlorococcus marinus str. MIT 9303]KZR62537.1 Chlorophyll A-B binding protein [Prochlorococcus marinus str. MIT 1312]KZR62901.1 Chlorophyll A-B binding protein [Prochlorococcus sp. MIT 1306]KZR69637.1 Chlorophyll A-B binding protein [Prochlorococcus marinus str. MIT 1313]KZR72415.1 Chlorophyll A-B binding protein [Prochlorococcus marinus str. MIT 1318]KZR74746.1 Chlorophyll A-B binding protein [Prochlorococcus marinus str. MIT 1320]KZR76597.1 Chlor|tara:strand:- start:225 stop:332 length:108 start_codon:yes stop_codon:yes gene_type:complete
MNENAELQNGRWAMIGFIGALASYAATGQIIPGLF